MKIKALAALAAACGSVSLAQADAVSITSNGPGVEGNGAFTGSLSYSPGVLTISLTNSLASNVGGTITGFVFNIAGDATASLSFGSHPFDDLGTGPSASPFGTFDAGAALDGDWTGGGSPAAGIARGSTGTFSFDITGPGAAGLTAQSFIGSAPQVDFVVRFRGFANGGSDKTPGYLVPAPASVALLGLAGLIGRRRTR